MIYLQQSEFITTWKLFGGLQYVPLFVGDPGAWSFVLDPIGEGDTIVLSRQRGGARVWRSLDNLIAWAIDNLPLIDLDYPRLHYLPGYSAKTVRIESLDGQGELL